MLCHVAPHCILILHRMMPVLLLHIHVDIDGVGQWDGITSRSRPLAQQSIESRNAVFEKL